MAEGDRELTEEELEVIEGLLIGLAASMRAAALLLRQRVEADLARQTQERADAEIVALERAWLL